MYRVSILASLGLLLTACGSPETNSADGTTGDGTASTGAADDGNMSTPTTANPTAASNDDSSGGSSAGDAVDGPGPDTDTSAEGDDSTSGDGGESESSSTGTPSNDTAMPEDCYAPGNLVTCDDFDSNPSIYNAMGLDCEGGPDEAIPIVNEGFSWTVATSWAILRQYGTYIDPNTNAPLWGPSEGDTMLLLSSGYAGVPDANGVVINNALTQDSNGNPDNKPMPAPMTPQLGAPAATPFVNCNGVGDCSNSLQQQWNAGGGSANDLIWFQFATEVPGGTHGFTFDFAYFSEEFPEWVNTTFNDMFVVWSNSETYTGNLCFVDDQPCTVTALWPTQYQNGNPPQLAGTGFSFDGATGWFQIKGSAQPYELLQLTFAVFDMGDSSWDTMVLLDHFAWDCEGCIPSEVMGCGIVPR